MTVVWAWADLGDNALQKYSIKQYWLITSVLSVTKFNPDWKKVFVVDQITYDFLEEKGWTTLWDEILIQDFSNTEFGNLYNIKIYSWPKLYSYFLIDDDILVLDIDVVFIKPFEIPDKNMMCGILYNHKNDFVHKIGGISNLSYKWSFIDEVQKTLERQNIELDFIFSNTDLCVVGSPVYVPKHFNKCVTPIIIKHIQNIENYYCNVTPNDTYQSIEEEFPLAKIGINNGGLKEIKIGTFMHGFINNSKYTISTGLKFIEKLLGIDIYNKYFT